MGCKHRRDVAHVVTRGEYSDYHIEAVFDNEKDAMDFCIRKESEEKYAWGYFKEYRIERYGMNNTKFDLPTIAVGVNLQGEVVRTDPKALHLSGEFQDDLMWGVSSRGAEVATKIARDYLAIYKYTEEVE